MTGPDPEREVRVHAPAKVNPWLTVLRKREDGFHELETVLMALELGDEIALRLREEEGIQLEVEGPHATPDIPAGPSNLAYSALNLGLERARELAALPAWVRGACVRLTKRIPSQSGLGGASSDAAAILRALESLLGTDLGAEWRKQALATLGSDCVFFEEAGETGIALCKGRGEIVEPFSNPGANWVFAVITPETRCATASIYKAVEFPLSTPPVVSNVRNVFSGRASTARSSFFNHLEEAALRAVPEIRRWRLLLDGVGASHFRLSGSGSSFFGVFDTAEDAQEALEAVTHEARLQGLALRGKWVTRAAGRVSRMISRGDG
jgi:4-diphosphocytidyl-2-C-methyl-D-erythritol kinase